MERENNLARPYIFSYRDYRLFLNDHFNWLKAEEGMSLRKLAQRGGLLSHSYFKQVMEGNRNLAGESIQHFARAFGLDGGESEYFSILVQYNQAEDVANKNECYHKLIALWPAADLQKFASDQYELFTKWYHLPILELVRHPKFKPEPAWVVKEISPGITLDEAADALQRLKDLKLVSIDSKGRWKPSYENLTTGDEARELAVAQYHLSMLTLASDSISNIRQEFRDLSALTLLVQRKDFHFIKEEMQIFRKRILQYLDRQDSDSKDGDALDPRLYMLCMQLFPLSPEKWKPKSK